MFVGYNGDFPYSDVTAKLVEGFPSWTKIRKDPNSIGHQFLNVFGLMLEEIENYLDEALNNQYIGTANLGEIDWIYKLYIKPEEFKFSTVDNIVVEGRTKDSTPVSVTLNEITNLHDFYASNDSYIYIIDYNENIIYFKENYDFVVIDGKSYENENLLPHHVWNVFDEFALLLNLRRRELETNEELKERILDVFRFPGNATKIGLIRAIGRELGLVKKLSWSDGDDFFVINDPDIIPETIIINGSVPFPGQIEHIEDSIVIHPRIKIFSKEKAKESRFENTYIDDNGNLVLDHNVNEGYYYSPVFYPRDLKYWRDLFSLSSDIIRFTGNVSFDLVSYDDKFVFSPGDGLSFENEAIGAPVRVRIRLSRCEFDEIGEEEGATPTGKSEDPQVEEIENIYLGYVHANIGEEEGATPTGKSDVSYIYGLKLNELHDEKFLETLFNNDGSPGETLREYVKELNEKIAPIMWGDFKWDEAYWDVVSKNLMGLHVLPNIWDPRLSEVTHELFQTGIGDGLDLKVCFNDNWAPQIHSGVYYLLTKESLSVSKEGEFFVVYTTDQDPQFISLALPQAEIVRVERNKILFRVPGLATMDTIDVIYRTKHYLFADCKVKEASNTNQIIFEEEDGLTQDTVIIVEADGKILKEVSFLSDSFVPSIENKEVIKGLGRDSFFLKYGPVFGVTINGESIDDSLINDNEIKYTVPVGEEIEVTYKVKDSFVFYYDGSEEVDMLTKPVILLSDVYNNIKVYYEGALDTNYYQADSFSLNPIISHINSGFLYITNQETEFDHFDIYVSPDVIRGNGYEQSLIILDAFDDRNSPVLNIGPDKIGVSVVLREDETGDLVDAPSAPYDYGTIIHRGNYYNRNIYVYKSPFLENEDEIEEGEEICIIPCTAEITFTCEQKTFEVTIKVLLVKYKSEVD